MLLLTTAAFAASPVLNLLPFGVGVYVHDRPVRGIVYSVTQAAGFAALAYGSVRADQALAAEDAEGSYRWDAVSAVGATAGFGSWIVSALDGGRLHELEGQAQAARLKQWDAQLASVRGASHD